jgi:hypothetical protein
VEYVQKGPAAIMLTTTIKAAPKASRFNHLKAVLESRRSELVQELRDRIRAVRSDGISQRDVLDDAEGSEVDIQDDIGFASRRNGGVGRMITGRLIGKYSSTRSRETRRG